MTSGHDDINAAAPATASEAAAAAAAYTAKLEANGHHHADAIAYCEIEHGQLLGQGAFGTVHLARWRKTPVAIKTADKKISEFEKLLFLRELDTMTRLRHPNIVQFLGFCLEPFCIALEYLPNSDLRTYCNKRKPPYSHKLRIAIDIMRGLAYLHNRKPESIIHRDIKPTNVLITPSGTAKISDFGLARMTEHARLERSRHDAALCKDAATCKDAELAPKVQRDRSGSGAGGSPRRVRRPSGSSHSQHEVSLCLSGNVGTLRYMAPEAHSKTYTCAVDIYSAGATLYELFEGELFSGLLWALAPTAVRPAVNKMCASEPGERPTALDAIGAFEELQEARAQGYIARLLGRAGRPTAS